MNCSRQSGKLTIAAVLLESRRLQIAQDLPAAATLVKELQAFQPRVTPVSNDTDMSWREQDHDDLVLAVALAGWFREWWSVHLNRAGSSSCTDRWDNDNGSQPIAGVRR